MGPYPDPPVTCRCSERAQPADRGGTAGRTGRQAVPRSYRNISTVAMINSVAMNTTMSSSNVAHLCTHRPQVRTGRQCQPCRVEVGQGSGWIERGKRCRWQIRRSIVWHNRNCSCNCSCIGLFLCSFWIAPRAVQDMRRFSEARQYSRENAKRFAAILAEVPYRNCFWNNAVLRFDFAPWVPSRPLARYMTGQDLDDGPRSGNRDPLPGTHPVSLIHNGSVACQDRRDALLPEHPAGADRGESPVAGETLCVRHYGRSIRREHHRWDRWAVRPCNAHASSAVPGGFRPDDGKVGLARLMLSAVAILRARHAARRHGAVGRYPGQHLSHVHPAAAQGVLVGTAIVDARSRPLYLDDLRLVSTINTHWCAMLGGSIAGIKSKTMAATTENPMRTNLVACAQSIAMGLCQDTGMVQSRQTMKYPGDPPTSPSSCRVHFPIPPTAGRQLPQPCKESFRCQATQRKLNPARAPGARC